MSYQALGTSGMKMTMRSSGIVSPAIKMDGAPKYYDANYPQYLSRKPNTIHASMM